MNTIKQSTSHLLLLSLLSLFFSCNNTQKDKTPEVVKEIKTTATEKLPYTIKDTKGILLAVKQANGGIENLKALKDVSLDYYYVSPDGKKDVSKEKYIFENEISWAEYTSHQVNFPPEINGRIVQFYNGKKAFAYLDGKPLEDSKAIELSQFIRQVNYFWFTMMFKLTDPGVISTYQGQKLVDDVNYDVLHVTYDSKITGKEENDIYLLYINPKTRMIDSFYFSLPAFGVNEPV